MDLIPVQIRRGVALGQPAACGGVGEVRLEVLYRRFGGRVHLHGAAPR